MHCNKTISIWPLWNFIIMKGKGEDLSENGKRGRETDRKANYDSKRTYICNAYNIAYNIR